MSTDAYRLAFWDGVRSVEWRMDLRSPGATYTERTGYDDGRAFALLRQQAKTSPDTNPDTHIAPGG